MLESRRPTFAFILEQTLGHVTHSQNLETLVRRDERFSPVFLPIHYESTGWRSRMPGLSNWTVRAGSRTRRALRAANRERRLDAVFFHTQVTSIFAGSWLRRLPSVVSIDATPLQIDALGAQYAHARSGRTTEALKLRMNRRAFDRAAHVVSWSEWSKQSLVEEYGVPASKVTVLAPGVDVEKWTPTSPRRPDTSTFRVLFVGGDLARKGGNVLIEAIRKLRAAAATGAPRIELHLVTSAPVAPEPGIVVHHGLRPNTAELIRLYHEADVFCLPTLGDCLPMVLSEAGAAGLPLVATDVGALNEIVQDGLTGILVEPNNVENLVEALTKLRDDVELRRALGVGAAALVSEQFDAAKNSRRIGDILLGVMNPS